MSMNFRGCRTKPGPKIRKDQAARPLTGADVLVAVRGPSPGEGGGKKPSMKDIRLDHQKANTAAPSDAI